MTAQAIKPTAAFGTLLACAAVICAAGAAADDHPDEYQVKAALIFNFMKFVEWPAEVFTASGGHITLCTIGSNPFGRALEPLKGKTVGGRTVILNQIQETDDIKSCHVLYVGESEKERIGTITKKAATAHVLTVGDTSGFAQRGFIINLYLEKGTVRFEINPEAARRFGLSISSKLLNLAKIVKDAAPSEKEKKFDSAPR